MASKNTDSPILKSRTALLAGALLLVAVGAGSALLFDHWDDVNNQVMSWLHQPHFRKLEPMQMRTKTITVTGEVVDAWCYASQTMGIGHGPGHLACAIACVNGGVTPGILEDKTKILYLAAKYNGYQGCREILLPLVGKTVTVTGWVGDLGGNNVLKIATVKVLDAQTAGVAAPTPTQSDASAGASNLSKTNLSKTASFATKAVAAGAGAADDCTECAK